MAEQITNPFENEKPKIVHLEKSESHYEYCRMQMHDINRVHKRTFFCNMGLCMVVCLLAMFQQTVAGFDMLSVPFTVDDSPGMILAKGIFQIIFAMIIILLGYLAWANFHSLNLFLTIWYGAVTFIGIRRLDYLSAVIGAVGIVFYLFSVREMRREGALSQMEGYPDFQEKFDMSKSDIVVQTLMAHKGERRSKSTLFTTEYSLRRKKKKQQLDESEARADAATDALAEELQRHIDSTKQAAAEPAEPEAKTEPAAAEASVPEQQDAPAEMTDIVQETAEAVTEAEETAAEAVTAAEETAAEAVTAAEETAAKAAPAKPAPQQNRNNGGKKKKKK